MGGIDCDFLSFALSFFLNILVSGTLLLLSSLFVVVVVVIIIYVQVNQPNQKSTAKKINTISFSLSVKVFT